VVPPAKYSSTFIIPTEVVVGVNVYEDWSVELVYLTTPSSKILNRPEYAVGLEVPVVVVALTVIDAGLYKLLAVFTITGAETTSSYAVVEAPTSPF
jgi:hypothetical protein